MITPRERHLLLIGLGGFKVGKRKKKKWSTFESSRERKTRGGGTRAPSPKRKPKP